MTLKVLNTAFWYFHMFGNTEIHVKRELELFGFEVEVFYYRKEQDY